MIPIEQTAPKMINEGLLPVSFTSVPTAFNLGKKYALNIPIKKCKFDSTGTMT